MRYQSYFNTALALIGIYNGNIPLVHFLKQYFAQHKKHGSKDRKLITHLCYAYYRLGHALRNLPAETRLRITLFLCNDEPGEWQVLFEEEWMKAWSPSLKDRIYFTQSRFPSFTVGAVFPWAAAMSKSVDHVLFAQSHFIQPDLFLRTRPGYEQKVKQKLQADGISFQQLGASCFALPNSTKIDSVLALNKEAVVQDYSSQQMASLLRLIAEHLPSPPAIWDCCAASGGKSILAIDTLGNASLTVSDIRPSILQNLKQRFAEAGIHSYQSLVTDLSKNNTPRPSRQFDLVICDAPCSGSGTWGRTPEQLFFFTENRIAEYAALQKKILQQVIPYIKPGGYLLYITCSVFKDENEEQLQSLLATGSFHSEKMELFTGYDKKADSMFAALLRKKG
jgi:16S rRNA (cytosine967-C5)-methyltransferase